MAEQSGSGKSGRGHCEAHGGKVPTFNIYGQQHHRIPFKEKSHHLNIAQNPEWTKQPAYRCRTDLMASRKTHMVPHKSYDFDGDGVVGQRDYFIGKHFDEDHDDRLNSAERTTAEMALQSGWLDKFSFGLDASGVARKNPVQQRRGLILTHDNGDEMGDTYPKHFNAHKLPQHITRTEMLNDRKGELWNAATRNKERWDIGNPVFIPPNPVSQEFMLEKPQIDHIHQRADAEHQASRVRGGLLPVGSYENPERQSKTLGKAGGYVENPMNRTRSQLLDTRKEVHRRQLEEQVLESEGHHVPYSVRVSRQEAACFEFRKPVDPFTLTKLKQRRKEDRIEYDQGNFGLKPTVFPRFSDQPHPWWLLQNGGSEDPEPRLNSAPARVAPLEADFKITEKEWPPSKGRAGTAPAGTPELPDEDFRAKPKKLEGELGANTKKRWTSALIEAGHTRNAPRYFDSLKPAQTYARDFEPLDNISSFDLIRDDSLAAQAKSRVVGKKEAPVSMISSISQASLRPPRAGLDSRQGTGLASGDQPQRQRSAPSLSHDSGGIPRSREGSSNKTGMEGDRTALNPAGAGLPPGGGLVRSVSANRLPGPSMMERAAAAVIMPRKEQEPPSFRRETNNLSGFLGTSLGRRTMPPVGGNWGVRSGGFQRLDETHRVEGPGDRLGSREGTAMSNRRNGG